MTRSAEVVPEGDGVSSRGPATPTEFDPTGADPERVEHFFDAFRVTPNF